MARSKPARQADDENTLLHELDVHRVELEAQNEELRRTQSMLEESRDRYVDLYDFAPVCYFTLDRSGVVADANLMGASEMGVNRTQLIGTPLSRYVAPEERQTLLSHQQQVLESHGVIDCELTLCRRDGTQFPAQLHSVAIDREANLRGAWRTAVTDISERRQVEQLRSDVVGMVSHELRSPLAVILGDATVIERLVESGANPDEILRWAWKIRECAASLAVMVKRLLDLSQIEAGGFSLAFEISDIGAVVEAAARSVPLDGGHSLQVDTSENLPAVLCDPERIATAISNLVSNAIKYSPEGGTVRVNARQEGTHICISVDDEGVGIARKDLPYVFERYIRGGEAIVQGLGGSGIGLYLTREIVEAHGGRLDAESELGKGSTFTVQIPIQR